VRVVIELGGYATGAAYMGGHPMGDGMLAVLMGAARPAFPAARRGPRRE
jgi:hypothetical protein